MNHDEFESWGKFHKSLFPDYGTWWNSLTQDGRNILKEEWKQILKSTSLQDAQASIVGFKRDGSRLVLEHPGGIRLEGLDVRLSALTHLELEGMVVKTNAGAQARTTAPLILLN